MTDQEEQKKTRRLRPLQVGASATAATTGAFLAAQLGVYGTVIGVGVMSLITTIGTELYIQSLERTRRAARLASRARVGRKSVHGTTAEAPATATDLDRGEASHADVAADREALDSEKDPEVDANAGHQRRPSRRPSRLRWSLVAASAVAAFVLAMLVVTSIEKVSGSTLSGAEGSTVGNIVTGDTGSREQAPEDQPEEDQPEEDPAPGPTDEPTEPGTDPTEPAPPSGEEEPEGESGPEPTQPPAEDDTSPPAEDERIAPPTEEEPDGQTDAPQPDEEPEPEPQPER